jgi:1-acyl-sn-glycerol-3-phosphate acyltransferase
VVNVPLFAGYQAALPADARGNGIAVLNTAGYACMTLLCGLMVGLAKSDLLGYLGRLWSIIALAGLSAALAWRYLLRDAYEIFLEPPFRIMYKIRGHGPGVDEVPRTGPLLIVANHSSWFDPVWLGCVLPRRLTGMLTAAFRKSGLMRFLGDNVVPVIWVLESRYRREAPELADAVAALDRGEAVLIFPEGQLRKREERGLNPFGRGVWHILKERPQTPVLICWIEGGWGSYCSYWNGPPATNKRPDFRRPIDVAVNPPQVLPAELLENHRQTRDFLMHACAETRKLLGLEPLPLREQIEKGVDVEKGDVEKGTGTFI